MPLSDDPDRLRIARAFSPIVAAVFVFTAVGCFFADLTSIQFIVCEAISVAGVLLFVFMWHIANRKLQRLDLS